MKYWSRILAILILAVVISTAFFLGGVIGYRHGFSYGIVAFEPANTSLNVEILRSFRRGDTEFAIKMLEAQLDWQIIRCDRKLRRRKSVFDFTGFSVDDKVFMNKVADYRDQYSSKAPNPKVRNAITSILKPYSSGIHYLEGMHDVR